jgi:hypothetical protein
MKHKLVNFSCIGHQLEVIFDAADEVVATPARLRKTFRSKFGLALIDMDRPDSGGTDARL